MDSGKPSPQRLEIPSRGVDMISASKEPDIQSHLNEIVELMREEIQRSKGKDEEEKHRDERSSLKDLAAAFAAISVFMASLSAAFLQYATGIFEARPTGTPEKRTDHAIEALSLLSVFLSLGSTCVSGFASITASRSFSKAFGLQSALGLASFLHLETPPHKKRITAEPKPRTGDSEVCMDADHSKHLLDLSIFPLVYSVLTFLVALLIFVWVEQSRSVSISLTVAVGVFIVLVEMGSQHPKQKDDEIQA